MRTLDHEIFRTLATAMKESTAIRLRQRRLWAPTADGVASLARSARQLARISASRISRAEVADCLEKYRCATAIEHACKLIRGDLLVEMIDKHGLRAIDVARATGERPGDLSQMYAVAKTFPRAGRPADVVYNHLLLATRMTRKFPALEMSAGDALDEISRIGLTQHRDVTRHFSRLETRTTHRTKRLSGIAQPLQQNRRIYDGQFQELLPDFADGSIKVFGIDPPYIYGDETYRARSARTRACDSDDAVSAMTIVLDLLRDWQPKLAPGGVVLLWQPWQPLLLEISQAIQKYQWSVLGPIIWDKGRRQPGNFVSPYSVQGELLWVLHRPGDKLENHDGSLREMILRVPPISYPGRAHTQVHAYEKPIELCELLIRKHSQPNDLVFDACGCTGSLSVAAINCGRTFIYAESHADNFRLGAARIAAAMGQGTVIASRAI
jgi:DNA modification methylase